MQIARLLLFRCCFSPRCRSFCFLCVMLSALFVPSPLAEQGKQSNDTIRFRLHDKYLILVQATVNGTGPFAFLLDTGSTHTVIDPRLARQLETPVIGQASLVTVSDVRKVRLARLKEVRVGDFMVSELGAIIDKMDEVKLKAPGIRGVLGEDFLSQFDILIDYRAQTLRFDGNAPSGERCRIETIGRYRDVPTTNRLLIDAEIKDVSDGTVQLQLDTAAKLPELFPVRPGTYLSQPWAGSMAFSSGLNGSKVHAHTTIRVGSTLISDQDVIQFRRGVAFDAVGLLPAAMFHSIYISHSGGFVILNPTQ